MRVVKNIDVDVEVEIDIDDVLEYIEDAGTFIFNEDINKIRNVVGCNCPEYDESLDERLDSDTHRKMIKIIDSLAEGMKLNEVLANWDKFTEEEFTNWIKNKK